MDGEEIAAALARGRRELGRLAAKRIAARSPSLAGRREDDLASELDKHLAYLEQALAVGEPDLFLGYVAWARDMLVKVERPPSELALCLESIRDVAADCLPGAAVAGVTPLLDNALVRATSARSAPDSFLRDGQPQVDLARAYLDALLRSDRQHACAMLLEAAKAGMPVKEIYLHVFQPCQWEVGRLWQTNAINVAQEHYCTAVTQLAMSQLYPYLFNSHPRTGQRLLATCAAGDLHEIGVRMVADFFEMEGWDTRYLGANTPSDDLLSELHKWQPHVLAISATVSVNVEAVRAVVGAVRAEALLDHVKILVGGLPFNHIEELWRKVGADATAPDASAAVALASQWARVA